MYTDPLEPDRYIVQDASELPNMLGWEKIVIDTETSGLHPHHGDRICGVGVSRADRPEAYYIPIRHSSKYPGYPNIPLDKFRSWLKFFTEHKNFTWIMHNAKYDLGMFRQDGIEVKGEIYDTMIAGHVIRGNLYQYSLDRLTEYFIPHFKHPWYVSLVEHLHKTQSKVKNSEGSLDYDYSQVPVELLGNYCMEDLEATRQLYECFQHTAMKDRILNKNIFSWSQKELLENEMKLVRVIFEMEWNGIKVDRKRVQALYDKTAHEMEDFQQKMYDIVGYSFHVNSWKQIWDAYESTGGKILYWSRPEFKDAHKYPHLDRYEFKGKQKIDQFTTKRDKSTGRPCWNSAAIMKYLDKLKKFGPEAKHAYDFILYYREYTVRAKILSTYLASYLKQADGNDRIHASFNATGARTGRFSCSNPNLQNQTKAKGNADMKAFLAMMEEHDETFTGTLAQEMRDLFIPEEGNALVSIDYSGQEYRWATYFAQDEKLLMRYALDPKTDYHQVTAELAGIDRDRAKTVNFGTLYGMGAGGLASSLTGTGTPTTTPQARALLDRVFDARPKLKKLLNDVSEQAKRDGYIQTPYGRVTAVETNREYTAINYLVQGTSADQMRDAMVRVFALIQRKRWPVKLIATVHDELLFEMPVEEVKRLAPLLAEEMCKCDFADIRFISDIEVGQTWGKQELLEVEEQVA